MAKLFTRNGKLLVKDGKLISGQECCCDEGGAYYCQINMEAGMLGCVDMSGDFPDLPPQTEEACVNAGNCSCCFGVDVTETSRDLVSDPCFDIDFQFDAPGCVEDCHEIPYTVTVELLCTDPLPGFTNPQMISGLSVGFNQTNTNKGNSLTNTFISNTVSPDGFTAEVVGILKVGRNGCVANDRPYAFSVQVGLVQQFFIVNLGSVSVNTSDCNCSSATSSNLMSQLALFKEVPEDTN